MKINGWSIFGVCIIAFGALLLLYGFAWGPTAQSTGNDAAAPGASAGGEVGFWYLAISIGVIVCGLIVLFAGQVYFRRSPRPMDPL